jgi:hypothetical protein
LFYELPRYVVNQVTAGDYDCPKKVLKFLTEFHAAFRMLNLRNDFLRKKFGGALLLVPCPVHNFFEDESINWRSILNTSSGPNELIISPFISDKSNRSCFRYNFCSYILS